MSIFGTQGVALPIVCEEVNMKFKELVDSCKPLQIVGVINAYNAIMAKKVGFKAIYLSGAGVANA